MVRAAGVAERHCGPEGIRSAGMRQEAAITASAAAAGTLSRNAKTSIRNRRLCAKYGVEFKEHYVWH